MKEISEILPHDYPKLFQVFIFHLNSLNFTIKIKLFQIWQEKRVLESGTFYRKTFHR